MVERPLYHCFTYDTRYVCLTHGASPQNTLLTRDAQVIDPEGFAGRVFQAHLILTGRLGRKVGHAEMAEMVAEKAGEDPVTPSTVSRWFKGTIPNASTLLAIAQVCEVDPGWLTFGNDSDASGPGNPAVDRAKPVDRPDGRKRRPAR